MSKQKAIIFGSGEQGKYFYHHIGQIYDIVAFSDNNSALWTTTFGEKEIPIIPPSEIKERLGDNGIVIICNWNHYADIARQLDELGIDVYKVYLNGNLAKYDHIKGVVCITDYYSQIKPLPQILILDLSGFCNLRCLYCPYHGKYNNHESKMSFMSWDLILKITAQVKNISSLRCLYLVGTGEPLLNPEWCKMANYVLNETGIDEIKICTNGMQLNEKNIAQLSQLNCKKLSLSVSIDGCSPQECEFWRKGSSYAAIKQGLNNAYSVLGQDYKTNFMVANSIVLPKKFESENDYAKIQEYLVGCSDYLKTDFPYADISTRCCNIGYSDYKPQHMLETIPNTIVKEYFAPFALCKNLCTFLFDTIAIGCNGEIMICPCASIIDFKGDRYTGNNVIHDNILDTWLNHFRITQMREKFRNGDVPDMCKYCDSHSADTFFRVLIKTN